MNDFLGGTKGTMMPFEEGKVQEGHPAGRFFLPSDKSNCHSSSSYFPLLPEPPSQTSSFILLLFLSPPRTSSSWNSLLELSPPSSSSSSFSSLILPAPSLLLPLPSSLLPPTPPMHAPCPMHAHSHAQVRAPRLHPILTPTHIPHVSSSQPRHPPRWLPDYLLLAARSLLRTPSTSHLLLLQQRQ